MTLAATLWRSLRPTPRRAITGSLARRNEFRGRANYRTCRSNHVVSDALFFVHDARHAISLACTCPPRQWNFFIIFANQRVAADRGIFTFVAMTDELNISSMYLLIIHDWWSKILYQSCRYEDDQKDKREISYQIEIRSFCVEQISLMFFDSRLPVSLRFLLVGKNEELTSSSRRVRARIVFLSLSLFRDKIDKINNWTSGR